jgi:hypothetical protein
VSASDKAYDVEQRLNALITGDTWRSLGSLGAHYTVTRGRYRLFAVTACVRIDFEVIGDGLQAGPPGGVTFANQLIAAARPASTKNGLPLGSTRGVTGGDAWPRWSVDTAGNVTVIVTPVNNITYSVCADIPLD